MQEFLDSALSYWDFFLLDGRTDDLLKARNLMQEYREAGGTDCQSTFEAIQQAVVVRATAQRKAADELSPPMTYAEKKRRVVAKLEDSAYDSVEEWADVILSSIGESRYT